MFVCHCRALGKVQFTQYWKSEVLKIDFESIVHEECHQESTTSEVQVQVEQKGGCKQVKGKIQVSVRAFWFHHPVKYDPEWAKTLAIYRQHTAHPRANYRKLHRASATNERFCSWPRRTAICLLAYVPSTTATILQDDFDRMLTCTLPAPTQVGVWIPKAKQGPTADFFRPLGMPDTLGRLQDGTTAAILFRTTRQFFSPGANTAQCLS